MSVPFPEDVRAFMEQNIDALEQLEILRVLAQNPGKLWSAAALSIEVQCRPDALASHLRALHGRGLVTAVAGDDDTRWRYGAHVESMQVTLQRLLQTYQERPVTMIQMVFAKKTKPLEAFADAFRLRRES